MSVRVSPHPSIVRSFAVGSVVLLMTVHAAADSIPVLDAVSREVAVRVESTQGQGKVELVRDAVSREVAVRVESTQGQGKVELVRDAVSREVAVRVTLPDCSTNTLVPASASVPAAGGAGSVTIGTNSASCGWQASSSVDWVSITSGGTGNGLSGIVSYLIAANPGTSPRVGTIVAQDAVHVVTQAAALGEEIGRGLADALRCHEHDGGMTRVGFHHGTRPDRRRDERTCTEQAALAQG